MEISELRSRIDSLDAEIAKLLKERFGLCREIGHIKKESNLPLRDLAREKEVLKRVASLGGEFADCMVPVYIEVISASARMQNEI